MSELILVDFFFVVVWYVVPFLNFFLNPTTVFLPQIIQIATQTATGVGYLHARGIIHKDLKSKNIFIENLNKVSFTMAAVETRRFLKP